ncbi:MAG: acetylpolyamine aminohydrolase [Desulfobacterales bacterium S5133MH4]|nr:MAG: acetylpolyamine aminohydrolase [Desulfobacterales bacterium S5133MH4]
MKVVSHEDFYQVYTSDPASAEGRMEAVVDVIEPDVEFVTAEPASEAQVAAAHTNIHVDYVRHHGSYSIAALAAGGAIQAARIGLQNHCFGLIRPPGHHASSYSSWGFCYFNNMAIALLALREEGLMSKALVLDIDLHFGDGTVNILGDKDWVKIHNPHERSREKYIQEVGKILSGVQVDMIGISAGFDNHIEDWGGLLETEDYFAIGTLVRQAACACGAGCFAILEGGYNHDVLGHNVAALIDGLSSP